MNDLIFPRRVPAGGAISVVAPSGPLTAEYREKLMRGIAWLEAAGFKASIPPGLFAAEGYLAGDDARRLAELHAAFTDPGTCAVWCVRGGYGSMRLLDALDVDAIAASRKLLIGFSDATSIELSLMKRAGLVTMHGPLLTSLAGEIEISRRHLIELATGRAPRVELFGPRAVTVRAGVAEGPLIGGNLSIISALMGTGHLPDLAGAILFIEDVNEQPYRIDRMLTQLKLAGALGVVAGLVVGDLDGDAAALRALVDERTAGLSCPVVFNFPVGHGRMNMALPQGVRARLDAGARSLALIEACVE